MLQIREASCGKNINHKDLKGKFSHSINEEDTA